MDRAEILFDMLGNAQPALPFNLSYSEFLERDSLIYSITSSLQMSGMESRLNT